MKHAILLPLSMSISTLAPTLGTAEPIDTGFNYSGVLSDAGEPANGLYDFQLELIDNAAVQSRHLAVGSVGSEAIADGSIDAQDLNSASGPYFSKQQVYEVTDSLSISDNCRNVVVRCEDPQDLILWGGCTPGISPNADVSAQVAEQTSSETSAAEMICGFCNESGLAETMTAKIVCVDVTP